MTYVNVILDKTKWLLQSKYNLDTCILHFITPPARRACGVIKCNIRGGICRQNTQFTMYTTTSKQQEGCTFKDSHPKCFKTTNSTSMLSPGAVNRGDVHILKVERFRFYYEYEFEIFEQRTRTESNSY